MFIAGAYSNVKDAIGSIPSNRRFHALALVVIALAGALSALWALTVPVFQAPDEPAHFDYAMSLYSAGRLVYADERRTVWIASPYTKYLMRAVDFQRIAWHSGARVPPGYGSPAFYRRIDAGAPAVRGATDNKTEISWLVTTYPFGFYALEALWMRLGSLFTSSLVTLFFMARLLCVFLMMVGLYFSYRTLVNLNVPDRLRVVLLIAIGFFPLTTFVSSYVQPDNLVFALLSILFFLASIQTRHELARMAGLGLVLGALSITKYQFFLSAAAAVVAFVAANLWKDRSNARTCLKLATILFLPATLLLALQHSISWVPQAQLAREVHSDFGVGYFQSVTASGIGTTVQYVLHSTTEALIAFFIIGFCVGTYWGVFGWFDTPLIIVSPTVQSTIRVAIIAVSVFVMFAMSLRVLQSAWRILRLARRCRIAAFDIAARGVAINSYVCFVILMIALYVVTNNVFVAEGRHWYAYILPAFLVVIWYAPRLLRSFRKPATYMLAFAMASYSLVGSAFAYSDIHKRYYGEAAAKNYATSRTPPVLVPSQVQGTLMPVTSTDYQLLTSYTPIGFRLGTDLQVRGVARFFNGTVPATTIAVLVDRRVPTAVSSQEYEAGGAQSPRSFNAGYAGFTAKIGTSRLGEGAHIVSAFAQEPESLNYEAIFPERLFFLTGEPDSFSAHFLSNLQNMRRIEGRVHSVARCQNAQHVDRDAAEHSEAVLLEGTIKRVPTLDISHVWLLLDNRTPLAIESLRRLPKSYDYSFVLPPGFLSNGNHVVSAFAIIGEPSNERVVGSPSAFAIPTACKTKATSGA